MEWFLSLLRNFLALLNKGIINEIFSVFYILENVHTLGFFNVFLVIEKPFHHYRCGFMESCGLSYNCYSPGDYELEFFGIKRHQKMSKFHVLWLFFDFVVIFNRGWFLRVLDRSLNRHLLYREKDSHNRQ